MTQPNRDLSQAAHTLETIVAVRLTAALEHVHRELSALDGFPSRGEQVHVRASSELTSVESQADARWQMTDAREELRDLKDEVLLSIRTLSERCDAVMRLRLPREITKPDNKEGLCCSNQQGKHAAHEWGDGTCLAHGLTNRGGLCETHWKAWYRARKRDGIDTSKDFTPVTIDGQEQPAWA